MKPEPGGSICGSRCWLAACCCACHGHSQRADARPARQRPLALAAAHFSHKVGSCWAAAACQQHPAPRTFPPFSPLQLLANNEKTYWVPSYVKEKRFHNWLENARDWVRPLRCLCICRPPAAGLVPSSVLAAPPPVHSDQRFLSLVGPRTAAPPAPWLLPFIFHNRTSLAGHLSLALLGHPHPHLGQR